jgi:hypothetical protein
MPQLNEYDPITVSGVDETDLLLWEIDGVIYKMTRSEFRKITMLMEEVAVTGTTYTVLASDQGKEVRATAAGAKTFTIPSTTGFDVGVGITISNRSATDITIVASGTTLNGSATIEENQSIVVKPRAGNTWDVYAGGGASASLTTLNAPTTLACANPGETTAAVTYTDTNSSPNEASWEFYVYDNAGYTLPLVGTFTSLQDATTVNITGLTASTQYWVRGIAKGDGVTTADSALSTGFDFTTDAAAGLDADAQAYITAEETAASINIDSTNENAISALYTGIKAGTNPYTTKTKGMFLGYGTGLINGKDLDVTTTAAAPTISAAGYTFDGTNDAIHTEVIPNTHLGAVEAHFIYAKSITGQSIIGARDGGAGTYIWLNSGGDLIFRLGSAADITVSGQGGNGRYAIYRRADGNVRVLKNGVEIYEAINAAASPSLQSLSVGCRNDDGTDVGFSGATVAAYIVGTNMTDVEAEQIDAALGTFVTATSRT